MRGCESTREMCGARVCKSSVRSPLVRRPEATCSSKSSAGTSACGGRPRRAARARSGTTRCVSGDKMVRGVAVAAASSSSTAKCDSSRESVGRNGDDDMIANGWMDGWVSDGREAREEMERKSENIMGKRAIAGWMAGWLIG